MKFLTEKRKFLFNIIIVCIILSAFFIRFWGIGSESYWLDESISVRQAQESYDKSMVMVINDVHLPLYISILNPWVHVFGISEISTRFLSLIFGVASVYVIFLIGRKLFNERIGLYSAIILAFSSLHVYYSQEARLYTLFVLLTILSFYYYISFIEKKNVKNTLLYTLFTILMIYTHLFAVLVVLAQNIYYLISNSRDLKKIFHWVVMQAVLFAFFIPWLPILFTQINRAVNISWMTKPSAVMVFQTFVEFFSNSLVFMIFLSAVFLVFYRKMLYGVKRVDFRNLKILATWALFPILFVLVFSQFFTPIYHTRYLLFSLPAFYILFAWCITRVTGKEKRQIAVLLAVIILSTASVIVNYYVIDKDNWRDVSVFMKENVKEGEVIIIHPYYHQDPFTYYYDIDCFFEENIYSCNFNKNEILSLNHQAKCCDDSTLTTSTEERALLGDYVEKNIWLISIRSELYDTENDLFNYLDRKKGIAYNRTFEGGINIYKFE